LKIYFIKIRQKGIILNSTQFFNKEKYFQMNHSTLLELNSTISLSTRLGDFIFVYILPVICTVGCLLKLFSIYILTILVKRKDKKRNLGNIYKYMLVSEISDLLIGLITGFVALFRCGHICEKSHFSYDFNTKVFELIFYSYLATVIQQFQTFLEFSLAIERIQAFSLRTAATTTTIKKANNLRKKIIIMLIVAFLITLPNYLLSRSITPIGILKNKILYSITTSKFAQNKYWKIGLFILTLARGFLLYIILLILNIIIVIKYNKFIKNKLTVIVNNRNILCDVKKRNKESGITKIVLVTSVNYLCGNLPNSIAPILFLIYGSQSNVYNYYASIVTVITVVAHENQLFLFLFYNKSYKNLIFKILRIKIN
jgi:hypothetical protein